MANEIVTQDESLFSSAISSLKDRGAEFAQAYNVLLADYEIAQRDPDLLEEWQGMKANADRVRNTIEWINSQVDAASNWLGRTFGFSGVNAIGAIPLIPIAYVTGALAALAYVIGDIYQFHAKVELVRQKQAPGDILGAPGPIGELGNLAKWIIVGAALYFLLPELAKKLR